MNDFLAMGGHGFYIWLCYGAGAIILMSLFFEPIFKRKAIIREFSQTSRRQLAEKKKEQPISSDVIERSQ